MMQIMRPLAIALTALTSTLAFAAGPPEKEISNGQIRAKVYLPDAKNGYYRGVRFDWAGVIHSLEYKGHDYYGPWFTDRRPDVKDFVYEGAGIVTGPASSIMGPAEAFAPIGYEEAKPGGTFVKVGVGVLRKPDAANYDNYRNYELVDGGKWNIASTKDSIVFTQELKSPDGYGYVYTKTIRLVNGKPQMLLQHTLKNTGTRPIKSNVYNHNFFVLDGKSPGPGCVIETPFVIQPPRPMAGDLATIQGRRIVYEKPLAGEDRVQTGIGGFSASASDYDFRVENAAAGAGMRVTGDKPLLRAMLWSIRSTISVEPFVDIAVEPGQQTSWNLTYDYYTLPR